jgi:hypothetical protein
MGFSIRKTPRGVAIAGGTALAVLLVGLAIKSATNTAIPYSEFSIHRQNIIRTFAQKLGKPGQYDIIYDYKNQKVQVQLIMPLDTARFKPASWPKDSVEYSNLVKDALNETLIEHGLTGEKYRWKIEGVGTVRKEKSVDLGALIIKGPTQFSRFFNNIFKRMDREEIKKPVGKNIAMQEYERNRRFA